MSTSFSTLLSLLLASSALGDLIYVNQAGGSDQSPYDTPAKGALLISNALMQCLSTAGDDTVVLYPAIMTQRMVYITSGAQALTNVTIRSITGNLTGYGSAEDTILLATAAGERGITTASPDSSGVQIYGLTLDAWSATSAGEGVAVNGAYLHNSIIKNSTSTAAGASIVNSAHLFACVVVSNQQTSLTVNQSHIVKASYMHRCEVAHNGAGDNTFLSSWLYDCLVYGNATTRANIWRGSVGEDILGCSIVFNYCTGNVPQVRNTAVVATNGADIVAYFRPSALWAITGTFVTVAANITNEATVNPLFYSLGNSATGTAHAGSSFMLRPGSPALNAATIRTQQLDIASAYGRDIRGAPRVFPPANGTNDTRWGTNVLHCDLGPYEQIPTDIAQIRGWEP